MVMTRTAQIQPTNFGMVVKVAIATQGLFEAATMRAAKTSEPMHRPLSANCTQNAFHSVLMPVNSLHASHTP